jgi:hypothetical protein
MNRDLTEVLSFRLSKPTLRRLDHVATLGMRTRGNQITVFLTRSLDSIDLAVQDLAHLVTRLHDEHDQNSPQAEFVRGRIHSTKLMLVRFCGEEIKDRALDEVRRRTSLPIPDVIPLDADGRHYGVDTDAG